MTKKPARVAEIPIAEHVVEPYDGTEGMVRCIDCGWRFNCRNRVPSMDQIRQHCHQFRPKPSTNRA